VHILLIHQAFAALNEAGGTRHYEIATYLAKKGHQVTIIASPISYLTGKSKQSDSDKHLKLEGIRIFRTYTYPALHKSFFHRAISFISFMVSSFIKGLSIRNVDIVWGTSPPIFQSLTAWMIARLIHKPFLLEIRDLWPAFAIQVGVLKNPLIIHLSLWLEKFLYRHADKIVVNSPGFIHHIQHKGARNIIMIPNGSDVDMFHPLDEGLNFRREHHLEHQFIVMYSGAHGISNDLEVILTAAKMLKDKKQIRFTLIGDGKEKPALMKVAKAQDLSNVMFIDPIAKDQMAVALAASDICIAILKPIELFKTTYPNKVFDYMAAGRTILLLIDGVIRNVVEEARCGIFVQPGNPQKLVDAISWMINHPKERKKMGKSGRIYLEKHFNRNEIADTFNKVIENTQKQWLKKY
jgi:glycosyltransferase involved in cell wall biosynthesis